MKRILLALVLALGLAAPVAAQSTQGIVDYTLAEDWDADSATYTAPMFVDFLGVPWNSGSPIPIKITTNGLSATVTALVANSAPFTAVAVGDEICWKSTANNNTDQTDNCRYVLTRASANSITVGPSTVQISADATTGVTFRVKKFVTGTAATFGWIPVRNFSLVNFWMGVDQIVTTTGIDYKVECRHRGNGLPDVIFLEKATTVVTTVGTVKVVITDQYDDCRLMVRMTSTDDGDDLTTNAEKLNIVMHGVVRSSN